MQSHREYQVISENLVESMPLYGDPQPFQSIYDKYLRDQESVNTTPSIQETPEQQFGDARRTIVIHQQTQELLYEQDNRQVQHPHHYHNQQQEMRYIPRNIHHYNPYSNNQEIRRQINHHHNLMRHHYQNRIDHNHHHQHNHQQRRQRIENGLEMREIDALSQIEFRTSRATQWDEENKKCSICLAQFEQNDRIRFLPCLHRFHSLCVDSWLSSKATCPLCGASFVRGFFLLRREKYYAKMFSDVEKMQIYNLSYLNSMSDLPSDKYILLTGQMQPNKLEPLISDPKIQALFVTYLPTIKLKTKKVGEGLEIPMGRMWQTKRQQFPNLTLIGGANTCDIQAAQNKSIILFDLPAFRDDLLPSEISRNYKENKLTRTTNFTEYAITPDNDYVICGKLLNEKTIEPLMVLGNSKEAFLDYLDDFLVTTNRNGKKWFGISMLIMAAHVIYVQWYLKNKKKQKQ